MDKVEAALIDKQYGTVSKLLEATCYPQNYLGAGLYAAGYKFPTGIGMDDFALRIKKRLALKELAHTTSLTTLPELVTGANIGQPVMALDTERFKDISIMKRQPGKSLEEIHRQLRNNIIPSEDTETEAAIALINRMLALKEKTNGKNPLSAILTMAHSLRLSGENPDLNRGNLILDEEANSLQLADQVTIRRTPPCVDSIQRTPRTCAMT